jgi:hypothetical protein
MKVVFVITLSMSQRRKFLTTFLFHIVTHTWETPGYYESRYREQWNTVFKSFRVAALNLRPRFFTNSMNLGTTCTYVHTISTCAVV